MILTKAKAIPEFMASTPQFLEEIGRVCYKSEDKITQDSAQKFIKTIIDNGHHSVIEHSMATVRFIIDRGVSHELVRHRLCAFSQESTRYCDYQGDIEFIIPPWCIDLGEGVYSYPTDEALAATTMEWLEAMQQAEDHYNLLRKGGWSPQQARSVLPNSLKTEIVVTANYREWRHIFTLRCSKKAHPQMREVMIPLAKEFAENVPEIFGEWG